MEGKTWGSPQTLQEPLAYYVTQMQTLTIMNKGVIKDYYHMTTLGEIVK